jgi:hypothetical protein
MIDSSAAPDCLLFRSCCEDPMDAVRPWAPRGPLQFYFLLVRDRTSLATWTNYERDLVYSGRQPIFRLVVESRTSVLGTCWLMRGKNRNSLSRVSLAMTPSEIEMRATRDSRP